MTDVLGPAEAAAASDRPGPPEAAPALPVLTPALVTLTLAAWTAMAEITRLTGELVDAHGRSVSLAELVGLRRVVVVPWTGPAWQRLHEAAGSGGANLRGWLVAYAVLDLVAVAALAVVLARHLVPAWSEQDPGRRATELAKAPFVRLLVAMVAVRLAADVLLALLGLTEPAGGALGGVTGLAFSAAWLLELAVFGAAVYLVLWAKDGTPSPHRRALHRVLRTLYAHRFSVVVLVVLAAVVGSPGGNMMDQFPDAERGWLDGWGGAGPALVAVVALVGLATVVLVLGRLRSMHAWQVYVPRPGAVVTERKPEYGWWIRWLVAFVVVTVALHVIGLADVDLRPFLLVVGVQVAVIALSLLVRWLHDRGKVSLWEPPPLQPDRAYARLVWATGDVLTGAVLALAGIGLVRAFTAPAVLGQGWLPAVAWIAGFASVVVAWVVGAGIVGVLDSIGERPDRPMAAVRARVNGVLRPDVTDAGLPTLVAWILAALAVGGLAVLAFWPLACAAVLGTLGLLVVALTGLTVLAALVVLQSQNYAPMELFAALHMRRNPVLTLLVVVPLVVTVVAGEGRVHEVRQVPAADAVASRPTLEQAFDAWVGQSPSCLGVGTLGGHPVRPLVLVAAAGGGIRATVWTTQGLQKLTACGPRPVFLSSGVSGGSLGLGLARDGDFAQHAVALAEPTPLAEAVDGLLVRDLLAGGIGVRVHDLQGATDQGWVDRAGLIEKRWETLAPGLAGPFLRDPGVSGHLVLNSTSVGTLCRVLVSDIALQPAAGDAPPAAPVADPDCRTTHPDAPDLPAGSYDLLSLYGRCVGRPATSTAAMLSARFPYVTPTGVIPACNGLTEQQLVDGGYAESDGLGTLVDLAPRLMDLVRRHNATVRDRTGEPFVVPTVVFLQNHFGTDVSAAPSSATGEILAPLQARAAAGELEEYRAARQRLEALFAEPVPCTGGVDCPAGAGPQVPTFALVAPATEPSVTAPLGWTLSRASVDRLEAAMDAQAAPGCAPRVAGDVPLCTWLESVRSPE